MLKISHVLQTKGGDIWSVSPKATVFEALQVLADKDVGALPVIENNKLVGMFSERDYARKIILKGKSSKEEKVGDLMTTRIYSITPDMSVEECMALMTESRVRHIPVFEDNKLIGIVSIGDVVNAIIKDQKITIQDLENYITS
ncbi:MAG TPA: CBS domain-containing protein [Nitrospirae bacterium]|nr:hypoxic response protein 1 [bacterium BMS3Abin10]GBE40109.1 hypoxic response protein 1 [bacterium BMS3Bbin08]HDH00691.1 CBS domain-containing protein [Nitrospirota bacterium]HDH50767.1 CBS domain-containing protein [Nitrospirota bacterium]HDO25958.1 CBS domain-containing protein [Nitrospirota bacterium]